MNDEIIKLKEEYEYYKDKVIQIKARYENLNNDFNKRKLDFSKKLSEMGLKKGAELKVKIEKLEVESKEIEKDISKKIGEIDDIFRTSRSI